MLQLYAESIGICAISRADEFMFTKTHARKSSATLLAYKFPTAILELPWPSGYELILVKVIGGRQEGHPVQKCSLLQQSPN